MSEPVIPVAVPVSITVNVADFLDLIYPGRLRGVNMRRRIYRSRHHGNAEIEAYSEIHAGSIRFVRSQS
jgi:hypothetical protein